MCRTPLLQFSRTIQGTDIAFGDGQYEFNVHKEPIINTLEECAEALLDDCVDFVAAATR